ncbi:MAG: acylphosphatase [Pirellulaceae bacterium]|nr:MAG: acylphosphatase [Pirellulaceae bacterium]
MAAERRVVTYFGHVQGVGFRYTTQRVARQFHVTGYVRNLPDGSVELVVEGEPTELERFLGAVHYRMRDYIQRTQVRNEPATGEFDGFSIRH